MRKSAQEECAACKSKLMKDAKFCRNCGKPAPRATSSEEEPAQAY